MAAVPLCARAGIPLGGGVFLPPLNGVTVADEIPPVGRDPRLPPPGPVVGKVVDRSGQEWWVHADGSQTSCCFASILTPQGRCAIVATQHGAPMSRRRCDVPAGAGK
ncbi:MAG: hypothetical protein H6837_18530 [Planctomycetes bacterium]|nr:hypothetical protein [Planctomycetota bacterium]